MKLASLQYAPQSDLSAGQALFRIQLARARPDTVRIGALRLAPSHLLSGRFDLPGVPVGYFAESPEAAVFESLCRRETTAVSFTQLEKRSLLCLQTLSGLSLLDLRPHASSWPVLQSLRFKHTQALALDAYRHGFEGIGYRSAQQFGADCYALFGDALSQLKPAWSERLVEAGTGNLHGVVAGALVGSALDLLP